MIYFTVGGPVNNEFDANSKFQTGKKNQPSQIWQETLIN